MFPTAFVSVSTFWRTPYICINRYTRLYIHMYIKNNKQIIDSEYKDVIMFPAESHSVAPSCVRNNNNIICARRTRIPIMCGPHCQRARRRGTGRRIQSCISVMFIISRHMTGAVNPKGFINAPQRTYRITRKKNAKKKNLVL